MWAEMSLIVPAFLVTGALRRNPKALRCDAIITVARSNCAFQRSALEQGKEISDNEFAQATLVSKPLHCSLLRSPKYG
jgi:hypothetical protein